MKNTNTTADRISGIKAGDYGIFFCNSGGQIVSEGTIPRRILHVSDMTAPERYRELHARKLALIAEYDAFINEQETAGLISIPCVGGSIDTENYPEVRL